MTRGGLLERLEKSSGKADVACDVKSEVDGWALRSVQERLLETHADLLGSSRLEDDGRRKLRSAIQGVIAAESLATGKRAREALTELVLNEVTGLGPIEPLVQDSSISEIMVNGPDCVWVERDGKIEPTEITFRDKEQVVEVVARAIGRLGRRLDQTTPFVDGRLPNGSRLHACIPPISLHGPVLTIRKFPRQGFTVQRLIELGTLSQEAGGFLADCVLNRLNLIVAGGTGSGKTSTLNALLSVLKGKGERLITIEDCSELRPDVENVVALEARPANIEGKGEIPIRSLVRNALRMRPDRIVVGEVRGAEAFDMLQAMNTGHLGSMSTVHANGPEDALKRLEGMALMAPEVPERVVRELVPTAIDLLVFQRRLPTGQRMVSEICLMKKVCADGSDRLITLFTLSRSSGAYELVRTGAQTPDWFDSRAEWRGAH